MSDRIQSYNCQVCNISCSGPENLSQHFESAKHKKKAQQAAMFGKLPTSAPKQSCDTQVPVTSSGSSYFCQVCDAPMTGIESYATHMAGARHRKNVHKLEAMEKLKGDGCLPGATSVSPQSHLSQADSSHQDKEVESLSDRKFVAGQKKRSASSENSSPVVKLARLDCEVEEGDMLINNSAVTSQNKSTGRPFACDVCKVSVSGSDNVASHLSGKRHLKMVKRQQLLDPAPPKKKDWSCSESPSPDESTTPTVASPAPQPCEIPEIEADENVTKRLREIYEEGEKNAPKSEDIN